MTWDLASLAPPGMANSVLAALLVASFAGSFITVAFGIGGGVLLLAAMASLVPPIVLIATHGVIQLGSNAGRVLITLAHVHWSALPAFALGSLGGAATGGLLVVNFPAALVQMGLGLFIVWSVLGRPPRGVRNWPVAVGAVSSFLTMFFGATGMLVAVYTKSLALGRHGHIATHAALITLQHGIKVVAFGLLDFAYGPWLGFVLAMILAGFLGTLAGRLLLDRLADGVFRRALDLILFVLAARLIWAGTAQLVAAA